MTLHMFHISNKELITGLIAADLRLRNIDTGVLEKGKCEKLVCDYISGAPACLGP